MSNLKRFLLLAAVALLPAANCDGNINDNSFLLTTTFRASLDSSRVEGNLRSGSATGGLIFGGISLSGDGSRVVFQSDATNLVAGDTNDSPDIFLREIATGVTTRINVNQAGAQPIGALGFSAGLHPSMSANGNRVAFLSEATNLVGAPAAPGSPQVYVKDLTTGFVVMASVDTGGAPAAAGATAPRISADGRYVVFVTDSALEPADTDPPGPGTSDVYIRDLQTGITEMVSVPEPPTTKDVWRCAHPWVSADGRFVVFDCDGVLHADDTDGAFARLSDIYIRDRQAGITALVSQNIIGIKSTMDAENPTISDSGRYVTFDTASPVFDADDTNGVTDVIVKDLVSMATRRVSISATGIQGNSTSAHGVISGDGRYVAFLSLSKNLTVPDENGVDDVFLRDLLNGTTQRISVRTFGQEATEPSFHVCISQDGRWVGFASGSGNLVDDDFNGISDVFLRGPLY